MVFSSETTDTATFSLVVELYVHFFVRRENFTENFISLYDFLNYTYFKYANKLTTKSIIPFYFFFLSLQTHSHTAHGMRLKKYVSEFPRFSFPPSRFRQIFTKSNTIINQLTRWKTMQLCVMKKNDYDFIISFWVFAHILHLFKGNWGEGRIIILKSTRSELYTNSFFRGKKKTFFFLWVEKKEKFPIQQLFHYETFALNRVSTGT